MTDDRIRTNDDKDDTIARVMEVAKALAPTPRKVFKFLGFEIKADLNLNTAISLVSLLGMLGGALWVGFNFVNKPLANEIALKQVRMEIGYPGQPGYVPGTVKGLSRRMDALEQSLDRNHNENMQSMQQLNSTLQEQGVENAKRFDRLDTRIDRLVESESRHPR